MAFFNRMFGQGSLYGAGTGVGQLLLVLPEADERDGIELDEAWSSPALLGNFVYAAADLGLTQTNAADFVTAVLEYLTGVTRGFVWIVDPLAWRSRPLTNDTAPMMGMDEHATSLQTGLDGPIFSGVTISIANGARLALDGTDVNVTGAVRFSGENAPRATSPAATAKLALSGDDRGTLSFSIYLTRQSLNDAGSWGFQLLFPAPEGSVQPALYEWLPLAAPSPNDSIGFRVTIDPSDPANRTLPTAGGRQLRSWLAFTGKNVNGSDTVLGSTYRTIYGASFSLTPVTAPEEGRPARLVFNAGTSISATAQVYQLAPMGEFTVSLEGVDPEAADLLCGLQGSETIPCRSKSDGYAGDRLRFTPYQPAYAPRYPFPEVSPVKAPVDVQAPLLDGTYTTSWANVVPAPGTEGQVPYVAQPKGSSLYGQDSLIWAGKTQLMGWMSPADVIPEGVSYPLLPYAGASFQSDVVGFTSAQMADFERQVIGPTRRKEIGSAGPKLSNAHSTTGMGADGGPFATTTPTGLIATIDAGIWQKVLLGQNVDPDRKMYFCRPDTKLQQAFQTGQLFLVAADSRHLGAFAAGGTGTCPDATPRFYNTMEIGGWDLTAPVGAENQYNDYRNVMIVKGRRGKLFDGTNEQTRKDSLVSNPERWTQKDDFATPGDQSELVILSQWLQTYFEEAAGQSDHAYFDNFNRIARDESWTGILFLRMDIAKVPGDLAGITAGVTDMGRFNAHHFGIEISKVTNDPVAAGVAPEPPGPRVDGASSMFGLIHYVDPKFVPPAEGEDPKPIPETSGAEYAFRLLKLAVLFENTSVKLFQSYAQLTLSAFFGARVTRMGANGNDYNAMVLRGTFQTNNGHPVYGLVSASEAAFYLDSDVLTKIEVLKAQMSTRSVPGGAAGAVISWFDLTGFMDFAVVKVTPATGEGYDFDVFSFGSEAGTDATRRGLSFSSLGLRMTSVDEHPDATAIQFVADEIRFDLATSTPRPKSLFRQFALQVDGLVSGGKDRQPAALGYLNVVTDARLTGVAGDDGWFGIQYRLNMGTPGNLAGKAGLTSTLLTAWSPKTAALGSYAATVGLQLPGTTGGAPLISLQTVLKLSLGTIRLTYDTSQSAFLLLLTEIALKLLGLIKVPPAGSTLFYLFGNPALDGKPSGLGWYAMFRKA
jgi:hypothetical protein